MRLQPRHKPLVEVAITVAPSHNGDSQLIALHWSLRDLAKNNLAKELTANNLLDPDRPSSKTVYHQGEIIPLEPERFWLVERGWVKLSTIDESGEQVLVGIAGPSMPFGSKMTSLSIYQATVLSEEVQLVSVPSSEIDNSSHLKDTIFAQLMQRLQQTESLLAIAGRRQLQSRLQHLLQWLQENFGQKVLQGDRLIVRLTHQELANACSTSRVTISRELSKLKKQGKIMYDSKRHIIFLDKS